MSSYFSGLEKLGLGKLKDIDIFASEEKKVEKKVDVA